MFTSFFRSQVGSVAVCAAAVLCLTGCPSMPMMTTAKTIGDGKNEIVIAPGVVGFSAGVFDKTSTATITVPDVTLGYRRGIGENFDLGATLTGFGHLQLDGKVNLLGNTKADRVALALDPTLGGVFAAVGTVSAGYVDFGLPLLIDLAASDAIRLTVGPRYRGTYLFGSANSEGASTLLNYAGTGLGAEFIVSDVVALQPWGTVDYLLNPPGDGTTDVSALFFTGGLAIKLHP